MYVNQVEVVLNIIEFCTIILFDQVFVFDDAILSFRVVFLIIRASIDEEEHIFRARYKETPQAKQNNEQKITNARNSSNSLYHLEYIN